MKSSSIIWNYANKYAYPLLLMLFILWMCVGIFPLVCYETDSLHLILGCDYAYSHGLKLPPVISYEYQMQPLTIILVVALKHVVPFLTCEQIYCLMTAVSSLVFLIGCVEFARRITKGRRVNALIAAMLLPEMYAIAMYPNSAILAAACFVWAMVCLTRERYWIAGLLMCVAPLLRADVLIVYPAVFPLFLLEGRNLKRSIVLSMIYGVVVVTVDLFFFWILKADFFSSVNMYDVWNDRITLTRHIEAIFGFYSVSYLILLPVGILAICRRRRWKELFLVLLPILLLHFFFRKMGCAAKHYLYIVPFVIIAGIRGISLICGMLSKRRIMKWCVAAGVVIFYMLSVRVWPIGEAKEYWKEDMRCNSGLIASLGSVHTSVADLTIGIGAGQLVPTSDESHLASGQIFYSWYMHFCKSELKKSRVNLKRAFATLPSSSIMALDWGSWAPITSMYLAEGMNVSYDGERILTIRTRNQCLSVWMMNLLVNEETWQDVMDACKKLPEGGRKYVLVGTFGARGQIFCDKLCRQNQMEKITDGLYEIK